jgi:tRNA(Ile)-lysidine synthase
MGTELAIKKHLLTQFEENVPDSFHHKKIHCLIAYSGGLDSHVLLHALAHIAKENPTRFSLQAIHIHHGLQKEADAWADHCKNICSQLAVPLTVKRLNLTIPQGKSLEAVARDARYQCFENMLGKNEVLLTAHHQNDQAETLLIQLFRGSGVQGLAAMPPLKPFAKGHLFRPLLNVSRIDLENYAQHYQLQYINDPSNSDERFDRNFIRHSILPALSKRWAGITSTLSRVSRLQAENQQLLEEYLQADYKQTVKQSSQSLDLDKLQTFSQARQKALIRYWLKQQNHLMPSAAKLEQIMDTVITAKPDANPCVSWENIDVRRFQQHLYAIPANRKATPKKTYQWDGKSDFVIPETNQVIRKQAIRKEVPDKFRPLLQDKDKPFTIRFRQDGERVKLPRRTQTHSLKKLMQTLNIPPWEREYTPLIFLGDQLICIYGYQTYETD